MHRVGQLPKNLVVNDKERAIRSDFRVALDIFQALNDPELSESEKAIVMIEILYINHKEFRQEEIQEAIEQASWFLDGGKDYSKTKREKKILDWEQDETFIFSAINKVAGKETREAEYMHWWTFLGYFNEIGEGMLSTILNIRSKKNKGKKLEKHEEELYRNNKQIFDIKTKKTEEEKQKTEEILNLFR